MVKANLGGVLFVCFLLLLTTLFAHVTKCFQQQSKIGDLFLVSVPMSAPHRWSEEYNEAAGGIESMQS